MAATRDAHADPCPPGARSPLNRDFVGRPRRRPGEGFAVPDGMWPLGLRLAFETAARPHTPGTLAPRWYDTDHGRLFARVSGGRAGMGRVPVVLVHGLIVTSRYFVAIALELGSDFTLLAPDLPGYGMSEDPPSLPTIEDLAGAVAACVRAAGHDRVALVANSFGAQIAVETAIRHERLVDRVVLLGPTTDPCARTLPRQYIRWQRCAPDEHLSAVPTMARDLADMGPRLALHLVRVMLPRGRLEILPGYAHMPHWSGAVALAPMVRRFLLE